MWRVIPVSLLVVGCGPDVTYIEQILAAGTTVALPATLAASAVAERDVPCATLVKGCGAEPNCNVVVDIAFDEGCPFAFGAATGTAEVTAFANVDVVGRPRIGWVQLDGLSADLSEVRIDGRELLVQAADDVRVSADYSRPGPTWTVSSSAGAVTFAEEPYIDVSGDSPWSNNIDTQVHAQGTLDDPSDDRTVLNGAFQLIDGDQVEMGAVQDDEGHPEGGDVTWDGACRDNPVSGSAVRKDETMMGRRDQDVVTFHSACDGMIDVDRRTAPLDLLR